MFLQQVEKIFLKCNVPRCGAYDENENNEKDHWTREQTWN